VSFKFKFNLILTFGHNTGGTIVFGERFHWHKKSRLTCTSKGKKGEIPASRDNLKFLIDN